MVGLGISSGLVYDRNHAILKVYNSTCNRVVMMRSCRLPGFEEQGAVIRGKRNSAGHAEKLSASLSRTRSKIFELALCNPWDFFVTLTLAPEKGNRRDLREFKRALSKWLNNINSRRGCSIKYLLIPEPHADGAWHMHGLFMGIPEDMLRRFTLRDHLPYRVLELLREGREIYDWPAYAAKFGHVTCERIISPERCAKYITKYISKNLDEGATRLNEKLYLCSHGLARAEVACRGHILQSFVPDFCNEYVALKTYPTFDDALSLFYDSNISDPAPVGFLDVAAQYPGGDRICLT